MRQILTDSVQRRDLLSTAAGDGGVGESDPSLENSSGVVEDPVGDAVSQSHDFRDLAVALEPVEGLGGDDADVLTALGPQVE